MSSRKHLSLRLRLYPIPTTEVTPGPAKNVTVDDEGVADGTSTTVVSDPFPPPASEDDGCTSVDTASTE
jgi:hypothetical protein